MKLSLDTKVRQSDNVVSHQFDGAIYILDPRKNTIRVLNKTAGFIWNSIEKWTSPSAAAIDLAGRFNASPKTAEQDVLLYLSKLVRLGCVSVKPASVAIGGRHRHRRIAAKPADDYTDK